MGVGEEGGEGVVGGSEEGGGGAEGWGALGALEEGAVEDGGRGGHWVRDGRSMFGTSAVGFVVEIWGMKILCF